MTKPTVITDQTETENVSKYPVIEIPEKESRKEGLKEGLTKIIPDEQWSFGDYLRPAHYKESWSSLKRYAVAFIRGPVEGLLAGSMLATMSLPFAAPFLKNKQMNEPSGQVLNYSYTEPTLAPQTLPPVTILPTMPISPEPTEPLKPVAEYLQKNGISLDQEVVDNLELSGLTGNNKAFLDIYKNFYPAYLTEKLPIKGISIDGINSAELAFMDIASKTAKTNDDKYFPVLDKILSDSPSSLEKLNSFDDKKTEQILSVVSFFEDYITDNQIDYLKTALELGLEDIAFDPKFNGEGYAAQFDEEKLLLYKNFTSVSENFEKMSLDAQIFILETEWAKQNKTSSENIAYINTIPITFNPNDKTKDSDNGGLKDLDELKYKGDILDKNDDIPLQIKYNQDLLIIPFRCDTFRIAGYFDLSGEPLEEDGKVRNYKGDTTRFRFTESGFVGVGTDDGHPGIDFEMPINTPIYAPVDGIAIAGQNERGALWIEIYFSKGIVHVGHLKEYKIESGQKIKRGDLIALSGMSGAKWPHTHMQLEISGKYTDIFRDELDTNSKSYWINDNILVCLSEDGNYKMLSDLLK